MHLENSTSFYFGQTITIMITDSMWADFSPSIYCVVLGWHSKRIQIRIFFFVLSKVQCGKGIIMNASLSLISLWMIANSQKNVHSTTKTSAEWHLKMHLSLGKFFSCAIILVLGGLFNHKSQNNSRRAHSDFIENKFGCTH